MMMMMMLKYFHLLNVPKIGGGGLMGQKKPRAISHELVLLEKWFSCMIRHRLTAKIINKPVFGRQI